MRDMPVRIVSDGVLTRSVRDTAAFYREAEKVYRHPRLAPVGDITRPGRARLTVAVVTRGIGRDASPEVPRAHPARPPRCSSRWATGSRRSTRPCPTSSPTTSSSTGGCWR